MSPVIINFLIMINIIIIVTKSDKVRVKKSIPVARKADPLNILIHSLEKSSQRNFRVKSENHLQQQLGLQLLKD